jgi:hypothetical protein
MLTQAEMGAIEARRRYAADAPMNPMLADLLADEGALLAHVRELQAQIDAERWRDATTEPPEIVPTYPQFEVWSEKFGSVRAIREHTGYYYFVHDVEPYVTGDMIPDVTHWRPLPRPPKEAQE